MKSYNVYIYIYIYIYILYIYYIYNMIYCNMIWGPASVF